MWDMKACLACLSTSNKLERIAEPHQQLYLTLLGIKISSIDGYPTYFCYICQAQMRKVLAFKRKCRRAYYVMKEIVSVREELSLHDIMQVNRRKTNLTSAIGNWKPLNTAVYSVEPAPMDFNTNLAILDQTNPQEGKPRLVRKELCRMGSVWNIDIMSSVVMEPDPEPYEQIHEPEAEEVSIAEMMNEPLEETANDAPKDIMNEFPEEVISDDDDYSEPEFGLHDLRKKKKKPKQEESEFQSKILKMPVNEVANALSRASIKCLSKLEQIAKYNELRDTDSFRTAPLTCGLCATVFCDLKLLVKHTRLHNKLSNSKHICDVCEVRFPNELDLQIHVAEKHAYQYTCTLCDSEKRSKFSYNILDDYIQHMKSCHNELSTIKQMGTYDKNKYISKYFFKHPVDHVTMYAKLTHTNCRHLCTQCGMKFYNRDTYNDHRSYHYKQRIMNPVKCDICATYFKNTFRLSIHMERWHLFTYKCKECSDIAFNCQEVLYHIRLKHPDSELNRCKFCDKQYVALHVHENAQHYNETHRVHCAVCGHSYRSLANLYKHQLSTYKRIRIPDPVLIEDGHACDQCNVTFLSLRSFQTHAIKHKHEVVNTFENYCQLCRMIFDTAEEYNHHKQNMCKSLLVYPRKCRFCDLMMPSYQVYRRHHKAKHSFMPLQKASGHFLCELCGESVSDKELHAKQHAEEVPLECAHCTPTLRLPNMWKYCVHMLTVHTPKPYICNLCSQSFETRQFCKWHIMKEHAKSSPYKCDTCCKAFYNIHILQKHCQKFGHTTQNRKEIYTKIYLYVYPHMRVNVSMIHPNLLGKLKMYLCDYAKTKRVLLNDINDYIYFENQDMTPPVVTESFRVHKVETLENNKLDYDFSLNKPYFETALDSSTSKSYLEMTLPLAIKNKPKKKKLKILENDSISSRAEGIKESLILPMEQTPSVGLEPVKEGDLEESARQNGSYGQNYSVIKDSSELPMKTMSPIESKKELTPEKDLQESLVQYDNYGQDYSTMNEIYESSQVETFPVEYEIKSTVEEEVEEFGEECDFKMFEENGHNFVNINGILYKLAEGYAFADIQN